MDHGLDFLARVPSTDAGHASVPGRDIVVIGGSAGSVAGLLTLVAELPETFPASLIVAVHGPKWNGRQAVAALQWSSRLPVQLASDNMLLAAGHIYVIPGGMNAEVRQDRLRIWENDEGERLRPSIDDLFCTAAATYDARAIGVVLSGLLCDGALGLQAIVRAGGVGLVQCPMEAKYPWMPIAAREATPESYCLPVRQIGMVVAKLVTEPAARTPRAWQRCAIGARTPGTSSQFVGWGWPRLDVPPHERIHLVTGVPVECRAQAVRTAIPRDHTRRYPQR